jgi:hypothetical protein
MSAAFLFSSKQHRRPGSKSLDRDSPTKFAPLKDAAKVFGSKQNKPYLDTDNNTKADIP